MQHTYAFHEGKWVDLSIDDVQNRDCPDRIKRNIKTAYRAHKLWRGIRYDTVSQTDLAPISIMKLIDLRRKNIEHDPYISYTN